MPSALLVDPRMPKHLAATISTSTTNKPQKKQNKPF
jgi:hypothetical protein